MDFSGKDKLALVRHFELDKKIGLELGSKCRKKSLILQGFERLLIIDAVLLGKGPLCRQDFVMG